MIGGVVSALTDRRALLPGFSLDFPSYLRKLIKLHTKKFLNSYSYGIGRRQMLGDAGDVEIFFSP